ncbi:ComEC/Rec2 family competence protein [Candidatus Falkowbacteria bacterium]|nr:ComEC/Rec2 family competence protein [Candidatus Falkowbacteria bacterium]
MLIVFWQNKKWRPIILWGVFLLLGLWRFQIGLPDYNDAGQIYHYNNQPLKFFGIIANIDERISNQKLTIKAEELINGQKIKGQVLITTGLYPKYHYGDQLEIDCQLKKPENFQDFDYEKYLARYDIYSLCQFARLKVTPANRDPSLPKKTFSLILTFKNKLLDGLSQAINEPQASILQAMILGNRGGIPRELLDKFSNSGISHIIAISGMNITIIVFLLMQVLINLGVIRPKAFWLASAGILIFVLMIGDQASALRAAIMGIVVLYAQKIGRLNNSLNAVIFAASLMLLINPKLLLSDVGFQLSFMAVLGLIYLPPIFEKYFAKISDRGQVKAMAITTISAQIMTLPLIIFYFHKLSLVSVFTNALILPLVPFLTIWGLVNAVVSIFSLWLGQVMGFVSWLGVGYILWIVEWSLKIPFAFLKNFYINILALVGLYGLIFWWVSVSLRGAERSITTKQS